MKLNLNDFAPVKDSGINRKWRNPVIVLEESESILLVLRMK